MSKKKSEKKKRKKLEKKRAKRKDKIKQIQKEKNRPITEFPLHEACIQNGWDEARLGEILVSRLQPEGEVALCDFLVDLDGFGLKDCFGPRIIPMSEYNQYVKNRKFDKIEPAEISALVHASVEWSRKYRFKLPKDARKSMAILPDPGECSVEFGRDGEPFLIGEESDIRNRLSQSGLKLEDFACGITGMPAPKDKTQYFASEQYLKEHDRNDPLVRLERLAVLHDGYRGKGETEKAEELHSTMKDLAEKTGYIYDYLGFLAQYQVDNEQMERALKTFQERVELTEDPEKKPYAQIDLADFMSYLGDALEADEIYQKVLTEFSDNMRFHLSYAEFLIKSAQQQKAREKYLWIISELKDLEDEENRKYRIFAYQSLYRLLKESGDKAEAKALYKEAKKEMKIKLG